MESALAIGAMTVVSHARTCSFEGRVFFLWLWRIAGEISTARQTPCRTIPDTAVFRIRPMTSRAEELDEALLDLRILLLELLRIHGEELELAHLRLVRGVLHVRMAGVEAFAVGHDLLHVAAEREIVEELRGVRMRCCAHDRLRRHNEGHAFLRIDDL